MFSRRPWHHVLAVLLITGAGIAAYVPGLHGPFIFDDFGNITKNHLIAIQDLTLTSLKDAAFSRHDPIPVHRALAMITYALNYYFAGQAFDVFHFKLTNLAIHIGNGLLVYMLTWHLMGAVARSHKSGVGQMCSGQTCSELWRWFPLCVALAWLLHPIQITSVLYVVQRMTSLAAMFTFAGLLLFVIGRNRLAAGQRGAWWLMIAGTLGGAILGAASKETAVLILAFVLLVELFFFERITIGIKNRTRLFVFYVLTFGLPVVSMLVLYLLTPSIHDLYLTRAFTMSERLMTESRVLFFYLYLLLYPNVQLFGLFHGFTISTGLLDPPTTLAAIVAIGLLIGVAVVGIRKRWILAFAILWFFIGHSIESSFLGLEIIHEHRNYVPSYGVIVAVVYAAFRLLDGRKHAIGIAMVVFATSSTVLGFATHTRADIWGSKERLAYFAVRNDPDTHKNYLMEGQARVAAGADARESYRSFRNAAKRDPGGIFALIKMQRIVYGLMQAIEEGRMNEDGVIPSGKPDLFEDELFIGREYLRALDHLISEAVTRRLQERHPIQHGDVVGLAELQSCVTGFRYDCAPATRVLNWLLLILDVGKLTERQRSSLHNATARMLYFDYQFDEAEVHLKVAVEKNPTDIGFKFYLADFYMQIGAYPKADVVLEDLERRVPKGEFRRAEVENMRRLYEERRARYLIEREEVG